MENIEFSSILSESDLEKLFGNRSSISSSKQIFKTGLGFTLIFGVLFFLYNLDAFKQILNFQRSEDVTDPEEIAPEVLITKHQPSSTFEQLPVQNNGQLETDVLKNNDLYIPSLKISAPIRWDTTFDESVILKELQSGVVHLAGTPKTGEIGNIVITGHSSYFPAAKGDYKTVFSNLPKTEIDDRIYILSGGKLYTYQVKDIFEVQPDETYVMTQTKDSQLTLITCTPVGTALRRLIVVAKQVGPDPGSNSEYKGEFLKSSGEIPGFR